MIDKATTDKIKEQAKRLETLNMLVSVIEKGFLWYGEGDFQNSKDLSKMYVTRYDELVKIPNIESALAEARELFKRHIELAARQEIDTLTTKIERDSE